jgi:hypothetical protein
LQEITEKFQPLYDTTVFKLDKARVFVILYAFIQTADQFSYEFTSELPFMWLSLLLYMPKVPYSHLGLASSYTCLGVS